MGPILNKFIIIYLFFITNRILGYTPHSETCNPQTDVYFLEDPIGNQSFLKCKAYNNDNNLGYWQRHYCPQNMIFEFSTQQCQTIAPLEPNILRQDGDGNGVDDGLLRIAILNGTCANGEYCIGGTVCDRIKQRCMCPYGTTVNFETLSCIQPEPQQPQQLQQQQQLQQNQQLINQQLIYPTITTGNNNAEQIIRYNFYPYHNYAQYIRGGNQNVAPTIYTIPLTTATNKATYPTDSYTIQFRGNTQTSPLYQITQSPNIYASNNNNNNAEGAYIEEINQSSHPTTTTAVGSLPTETETTNYTAPNNLSPGDYYRSLLDQIIQFQKNSPLKDKYSAYVIETKTTPEPIASTPISVSSTQSYYSMKKMGSSGMPSIDNMSTTNRIIKIVGVGSDCSQTITENAIIICGESSTCINERCTCVLPLHEENERCVTFLSTTENPNELPQFKEGAIEVGPGEPCTGDRRCGRGSVCDEQIPICVCPQETFLRKGYCVTSEEFHKASNNNIQTTLQSTNPPSSTKPILNKFERKNVLVGDKCQRNTDCANGAYCNGNTQPPTCQCLSTHISVDSVCEKVIYPGQRGCRSDLQCAAAFSGATCSSNGECVCPFGGVASEQTCVIGSSTNPKETNNNMKLLTMALNLPHSVKFIKANCFCIPSKREVLVKRQRRQTSFNQNLMEITSPINNDNTNTFLMLLCLSNPLFTETFALPTKKHTEHDCQWSNCNCRAIENQLNQSNNETNQHKIDSINGNRPIGIDQLFLTLSMVKSTKSPYYDAIKERDDTTTSGKRSRKQQHSINFKIKNGKCFSKLFGWTQHNFKFACAGEQVNSHKNNTIVCAISDQPTSLTNLFCNEKFAYEESIINPQKKNLHKQKRSVGEKSQKIENNLFSTEFTNSNDKTRKLMHVKAKQPGEKCKFGDVCLSGTSCIDNICSCPSNYNLEDHKCIKIIEEKSKLSTIATTYQSIVEDENLQQNNEEKMRRKSPKKFINDTVIETIINSQNPIDYTDLNERMISLINQSTIQLNELTSSHHLTTDDKQQANNLLFNFLQNGTNYSNINDYLLPVYPNVFRIEEYNIPAIERISKSSPGQLCTITHDRIFPVIGSERICTRGSVCVDGICLCPEGTTLFNDECLKKLNFGDTIKLNKTDLMSASDEVKIRPENLFHILNQQETILTRTRVPGAMCQTPFECPIRTECIRGVCRCKTPGETIVNGLCRKAIYEVLPGGSCDIQKGLDCVGESHCFYGICVCLYGLVNTGRECASREILAIASVGESCVLGQKCVHDAICTKGICECKPETVFHDITAECVPKRIVFHSLNSGYGTISRTVDVKSNNYNNINDPSDDVKPNTLNKLYGITPRILDDSLLSKGKIGQILTANQMSINVIDKDALQKAALWFLSPDKNSRTKNFAGEHCGQSTDCVNGAKCIRAICQCENNYIESSGVCIMKTNTKGKTQSAEEEFIMKILEAVKAAKNHFHTPTDKTKEDEINYQIPCPGENVQIKQNSHEYSNCSACNNHHNETGTSQYSHKNRHRCPQNIKSETNIDATTMTYQKNQNHAFSTISQQAGADCSKPNLSCGWNSVCNPFNGICECPIGMDTYRGACVLARRPRGNHCFSSLNCGSHNYCDNGYCLCQAEFKMANGFCLPPAKSIIDDTQYLNMNTEMQHRGNGLLNRQISSPSNVDLINNGIHQNQLQQSFLYPQKNIQLKKIENNMNQFYQKPSSSFSPHNGNHIKNQYSKNNWQFPVGNIAMPGQFCDETRICYGNSKCINFICRCAIGWQIKDGICTLPQENHNIDQQYYGLQFPTTVDGTKSKLQQKRRPYDSCGDNFPPCTDNADCIGSLENVHVRLFGHSLCICRPGFVYVARQCIPIFSRNIKVIGIGGQCFHPDNSNDQEQNIDICSNGSYCDITRGICSCELNQTIIDGVCITYALPGESCENGQLCTDNSICEQRNHAAICVCPYGMHANDGHCDVTTEQYSKNPIPMSEKLEVNSMFSKQNVFTKSFLKNSNTKLTVAPSQPCGIDINCTENAFCSLSKGLCICNTGFVEIHNKCVPMKHIRMPGEYCKKNDICSEMSWCKEGKCQCMLSQDIPHEGKCINLDLLTGESWEDDISTVPMKPKKYNRRGKLKNATTVEQSKIFPCNMETECPIGSICQDQKCLCNDVEVITKKQSHLMMKERRILKCKFDIDCPKSLTCFDNTCVCIRMQEMPTKHSLNFAPPRFDFNHFAETAHYPLNQKRPIQNDIFQYNDGIKKSNKDNVENDNMLLPNYINESKYKENRYHKPATYNANHVLSTEEAVSNFPIEDTYSREQSIPVSSTILMSGTLCDKFNKCGKGAECVDGVCECVTANEHLAYINDAIVCIKNENNDQGIKNGTKFLNNKTLYNILNSKLSSNKKHTVNGNVTRNGSPQNLFRPTTIKRKMQIFSPLSTNNLKKHQQLRKSYGIQKLKLLTVGELCEYSYDCEEGLTCFNNICSCMQFSGPNNLTHSSCTSFTIKVVRRNANFEALAGESCANGEQCTQGSRCENDLCLCPDLKMLILNGACVEQNETLNPIQFSSHPTMNSSINIAFTPTELDEVLPTNDTIEEFNKLVVKETTTILPTQTISTTTKVETTTRRVASPGTLCGPLDICIGGSSCVEGLCLCPAGTKASQKTNNCEFYAQTSPIYTKIKTELPNISLPSIRREYKPTNFNRLYSHPKGSCSNNEICTGGSICMKISEKEVCTCPSDKPIIENYICISKSKDQTTTAIPGTTAQIKFILITAKPGLLENTETTAKLPILQSNKTTESRFSSIIPEKTQEITTTTTTTTTTAAITTTTKTNKPSTTARLGEKCNDYVNNCEPGAYCSDGLCRCETSFVPLNWRCVELPKHILSIVSKNEIKGKHLKQSNPELTTNSSKNQTQKFQASTTLLESLDTIDPVVNSSPNISFVIVESAPSKSTLLDNNKVHQAHKHHTTSVRKTTVDATTNKNTIAPTLNVSQKNAEFNQTAQRFKDHINTIDKANAIETNSSTNQQIAHNNSIDEIIMSLENVESTRITVAENVTSITKIVRRLPKKLKIENELLKISTIPTPPLVVISNKPMTGICPLNNQPLKDLSTGRLILCNGLKPNCPPKSYCFVTGVASGIYNCCKAY